MPNSQDFYVRFWGVRGSIACPSPHHDDEFMDGVAQAVTQKRPGSIVASEGLVLRP